MPETLAPVPTGETERAAPEAERLLAARFQEALSLHRQRKTPEARAIYEAILRQDPGHFDSLHMLGVLLRQSGDLQGAVRCLEAALARNPASAAALYNYGNALTDLNRLDAAIAAYGRSIARNSASADAYFRRGNCFLMCNRNDEAIGDYDGAIAREPAHAPAYCNRGVALLNKNAFEAALASLDHALRINPRMTDALVNRGNALRKLGRLEEALASQDSAIALEPDKAIAHYNRANVLCDLKRWDEAIASYDRTLQLKPGYAGAHVSRGNALRDVKRYEEALVSYRAALHLDPGLDYVFGDYCHAAMKICKWDEIGVLARDMERRIGAGQKAARPFVVLGLLDSPKLQLSNARSYAAAEHPAPDAPPRIARTPRRGRIRIGYISPDFRQHATSLLLAGVIENHDRARFDTIAFAFGPPAEDRMRQRLRGAFSEFVDVTANTDEQIASLIRERRVDIAVDLAGYTENSRTNVFARRPAPIQASYLGFPGTMGAGFIDYILADHSLVPEESRADYAEKVVRLPHSYQANDRTRKISAKPYSRSACGLPETGFVFCCFNTNWKILPATFAIWMRLLALVGGSVLWLMEDNPAVVRNLRGEAQRHGIAPERLVFASRLPLDEHLARHRCADLFLDTLPCNAHTTASDALWAGLPVLTQAGRSFSARVAASILSAMDLGDLITHSAMDYEAKALELAGDPARLAAIRARVENNRLTSPLFDAARLARSLEAAYAEMVRRHDAGLPPGHIDVDGAGAARSLAW